jgi:hypothetical protein
MQNHFMSEINEPTNYNEPNLATLVPDHSKNQALRLGVVLVPIMLLVQQFIIRQSFRGE